MRRLLVTGATVAGLLVLPGCVFACPTIGHLNIVTISTQAEVAALECVEGCEGGVDDPNAEGSEWRFDAPGRPETVTVVGRDAVGVEILREEIALIWTVADPGNRCGSSASADPVTIP